MMISTDEYYYGLQRIFEKMLEVLRGKGIMHCVCVCVWIHILIMIAVIIAVIINKSNQKQVQVENI